MTYASLRGALAALALTVFAAGCSDGSKDPKTFGLTVTVVSANDLASGNYLPVGKTVLVGPAGAAFGQPREITMPYDPSLISAAGRTTADMIVLVQVDSTSQIFALKVLSVDTVNHFLTVQVLSAGTLQAAVPSLPDATASSVTVAPSTVQADGVATATITVVAKNRLGQPMSAVPVLLQVSGGLNVLATPFSATDSSGTATSTLASTLAETKTITAIAAGITLDTKPTVLFQNVGPTAVSDTFTTPRNVSIALTAGNGLLSNDSRGQPPATIASFGGGSTGGTVTTNGQGNTLTLAGAGSLTVNSNGSLTFVPPTGFAGAFTFLYRLANGVGTSDALVTINVTAPPLITSAPTTTFTAGIANIFTVTATGFPTPAITLTTGTLPSGVTFNPATGVLSGTPAAGTGGTFPLLFTAANGIGTDATQNFTLTVNQAPVFTSNAATTFIANTNGNFTVTTQAFPNATIGLAGTLPSGVSFTNNGDGTATINGTPAPATGGTYPVTLTATNGVLPNATQNLVLTVNQAPAITSNGFATLTVGTAGSFLVTSTGFPFATISTTDPLPTGVTLVSNGNGTSTLSGTPAALTGRVYPITFTAANGVGTNATQSFTLTVNEAPVITSAIAAVFTENVTGTFTVTTTGFPNAVIGTTGTRPSGVNFVSNGDGTGTLSGTPATGSGGTYALTFTATNVAGTSPTQNFTLTVNFAPTLNIGKPPVFTVGSAGTFTISATGAPTPSLTTVSALPSGVTFVDNLDGTATLAGTPAAGTGGTFAIDVVASNGVSPDANGSFTLTVQEPPSITSDIAAVFTRTGGIQTFVLGSSSSFTITTAPGFPVSPVTISYTGTLPTGVSFLDNGDGTATLSGDPEQTGVYPLTITASNGVLPDATQSFTLTVNELPEITSSSSTTFQTNVAGSFTVNTTGFPTPTITLSPLSTLPLGVTFTDNGDGTATIAGTPTAFAGGPYSLDLTASNGAQTDATQTFMLTVNQAPSITSDTAAVFTASVAGTFTVTTTGFPTVAIGIAGTPLPSGVTFTDNGNGTGTLAGTPGPGTGGGYTLTFTASNGVSPDAVQTFTLTVNELPVFTSGTSTTFSEGVAGNFAIAANGFPAVSTIALTGTLPGGVTFTDNGGGSATLAGTPDAGSAGTYNLTFTASNGLTPATPQSFTLTVDVGTAVLRFVPTRQQAGKTITIVGTSLSGATDVTIGGASATNILINTGTHIVAEVPAGATDGSVSVTTGIGTGTKTGFVLLTPPTIVITSPATSDTVSGCVSVTYTITQAQGVPCDVVVEFGDGEGTSRATEAGTPGGAEPHGIRRVTTSSSGTSHTFAWNTQADLGEGLHSSVEITITASLEGVSGPGGDSTVSDLTIDNRRLKPVTTTDVGTQTSHIVQSVASGDLDGDGKLDLVVRNTLADDGVFTLMGQGNGTFSSVTKLASTGSGALASVAVADFNGDNLLDIVSTTGTSTVTFYTQGPVGTFTPTDVLTTGESTGALAVADVDGDGKPDVLVVDDSGGAVFVFLNSTTTFGTTSDPPTFIAPPTNPSYGVGSGLRGIAIADFNRDGKLDFVVADSATGNLVVLLGDGVAGDVTFTPSVAFSITLGATAAPSCPVVGDVNGDGRPDIVCANGGNDSGFISISINNGAGFVTSAGPNPGAARPSVAVGDVNGDGLLDVVVPAGTQIILYLGRGDGSFIPGNSSPSNTAATGFSIALVRLNADSKLDVVMGNDDTSADNGTGVTTFLNQGAGRCDPGFAAPLSADASPIFATPVASAIADLDGDGKADAVALLGDGAYVLLGNGGGRFAAPAGPGIPATGTNVDVAVGDLDGDGLPDTVIVSTSPDTVSVRLGTGGGALGTAAEQTLTAGAIPVAVTLADLDVDGDLDAVVTAADGNVYVLLNNGSGTLATAVGYAGATGASFVATVVGDVNNDAIPDLVVASTTEIRVLLGTGDGTFAAAGAPVFTGATGLRQIAVVDLDGDGNLDLIALDPATADGLTVQPGFGDGTFDVASTHTLPVGSDARSFALGDVSNDGNIDVVIGNFASRSVTIFGGDGGGGFGTTGTFAAGRQPTRVALVDTDGDGIVDVVVTHDNGLAVLTTDPATTSLVAAVRTDATLAAPSFAAWGNWDGSLTRGLDVVVFDATNGMALALSGNTDGSFSTSGTPLTIGAGATCAALGDLVGTAAQDLAIGRSNGTIDVLTGDLSGNFVAATTLDTQSGNPIASIVLADMNSDGLLDVVATVPASDAVAVFINSGGGSFQAVAFFGTGAGTAPTSVAVGNLDGDGNPDVVTTNSTDSSVSVLLGSASGTLGAATPFTVFTPSQVAIGDVNGDGKNDLLVLCTAANNVKVLLGDGAGSFAAPTNVVVDQGPTALVVRDMDGDGTLDLVVASNGRGRVSVLYGTGTGTFGSPVRHDVTDADTGASQAPISLAASPLNGNSSDQRAAIFTVNTQPVAGVGNVLGLVPTK